MPITNRNTLIQALANIRLESLNLSEDVAALIEQALSDKSITTTQILEVIRSKASV